MKFTDPWSWSKLDTYRQCPRKFKYQFIDKLPTPGSPAMDRGSRIHNDLEAYIKGWTQEIPKEAIKWQELLETLRADPTINGEQGQGLSREWKLLPDWFGESTWLRIKVDATLRGADWAQVIDWKTGKFREPSTDQLKLYAIAGMAMDPTIKYTVVTMIFVDQYPVKYTARYTRDAIKTAQAEFTKEVDNGIYKDESWHTQPSQACRWCPFSKYRGGPCEF